MGEFSTLNEGITNVKDIIGDTATNITSSPVARTLTTLAIGGAIGGGVALLGSKIAKRRKKSKSKYKSSRKKSVKHRRKRKLKYPRTAGKNKDTSHRRIRMTKNGQPYIIQANGRARFISKSSARRSRKLKGGRY